MCFEEVQFLVGEISETSERMYARFFTGTAKPWTRLLETRGLGSEISDVVWSGTSRETASETLKISSFVQMCHHIKHSHPARTFGFNNVFGEDFLEV